MRFLLPLPARAARRGLPAAVAGALIALTSACSFFTGVPDVTDVDVSLPQPTIRAGTSTQAVGTVYGNGHKVLQTSRVTLGYSSSNAAVATVSPGSGVVTGVSEGTAVITAATRGKSDTVSIIILAPRPSAVNVTPPNVSVGETVTLDIRPLDQAGQLLVGRRPVVTSSNPAVLRVNNSGTTTVSITGIIVGQATLTIDVDGYVLSPTVTVAPVRPTASDFKLAKGTNTLLRDESNQAVLTLREASGAVIPLTTQSIAYASDDQTIAVVNPSTGVVTGVRAGSTVIRANIANATLVPSFTLIVTDLPARQVRIVNRSPFVRLGVDGNGLPSPRPAVALDSLNRELAGRLISYRSTDNSVFTVNALGTVSGRKLGGRARLIASTDNGTVADTLELTVTETPIVAVTITPKQQTIVAGETIQFTLAFKDSLLNTVTSDNVTYLSNNTTILPVTATGLATGLAAGVASVQVQVNQVAGIPIYTSDVASVTVLAKPVASLDANPTSATVKVGQSTNVLVVGRAADGTQLFGSAIIPTPKDPTIVTVSAPSINGTSTIQGLKAGTTDIVYQAINSSGIAVGTPVTVSVTVTGP